jgi:hypothetical protein
MSAQDYIQIIGAIAAAVVLIIGALERTHRMVNGRMTELLALTKAAAIAEGKLQGPDPPDKASAFEGPRALS